MGNKQPKHKHLLHYHRTDENKLWVFYPDSEIYTCFPVYSTKGPFFFANYETISIPSLNAIYVVGGSGFQGEPTYSMTEDPFNAKMGYEVQTMPTVSLFSCSC